MIGEQKITGLYRFPKELLYPELANRKAEFVNYRTEDTGLTTDTVMSLMMAAQVIEEFMVPPSTTGRQVY